MKVLTCAFGNTGSQSLWEVRDCIVIRDALLTWVKVPLGVHITKLVNTAGGIFSSVRDFNKSLIWWIVINFLDAEEFNACSRINYYNLVLFNLLVDQVVTCVLSSQ